ncbi:receptor-type tyrosine-protein phosphatase mu-like, partial [Littorina saxatilis]|uniref:receptor-type tyrosine-protein phosphatase mu-like n=1 Tax=Littorina saxatilis TaxID=31220 RepID=UPI0038B51E29
MTTTPTTSSTTTPTTRITTSKLPPTTTSTAISNGSTMTRPKEDSPPDTTTVIAGAVGAVVALIIAVIIVVFVVIRKKRRKTPDPEHCATDNTEHPGDNETVVMHDDVMMEESVCAAEDPKTDHDQNEHLKATKPVIAVKPTFVAMNGTNAKNTANGTPTANYNPESSLQSSSSNTTSESETSLNSPDHQETSSSPEAEVVEDEVSLAEDDHVYENREEVHAVFRRSVPHLDSVQIYLVDRLASHQLSQDFKKIALVLEGEPRTVGRTLRNAKKNRFTNVFPYDKNRVVLSDGYNTGPANDYVNASYIRDGSLGKGYIAAQGPMDTTAGDFWRMVWQEKTTDIVMLTNMKEGEKEKCFQYWPEESGHVTYGPITVTSTHVECRDNFFIRTFTVKRKSIRGTREVTQYHYVSWPDHGVPT